MFNIIGKRYWFFALSALVIIPGVISFSLWQFKLGPDFAGGSETLIQIPLSGQNAQLQNYLIASTGITPEFVQPIGSSNCAPECQYNIRSKFLTEKKILAFKADLRRHYPGHTTQISILTPGYVPTSSILASIKNKAPAIVSVPNPNLATDCHPCEYGFQAGTNLSAGQERAIATAVRTSLPAGKVLSIKNVTVPAAKGSKAAPTQATKIRVQLPYANQRVALAGVMDKISPVSHTSTPKSTCAPTCIYVMKTGSALSRSQKGVFRQAFATAYGTGVVKRFKIESAATIENSSSVSGSVAASTTTNAIEAVIAAAVFILLYITFAFRRSPHPFRYGMAAIIAMLHDVLVVAGIFSILGHWLNVEIDATFVTAMLTIIGFSVHDTIVIFDRIRENVARRTGEPFEAVVNHSVLQSFVRSINTSFTVVLTLGAIFLFSGESIRYFVLAMLIGIISGTYSSIFNASPILVVWQNGELGRLFGRRPATDPAAA